MPDAYVKTGTSSFLSHVPRCSEIGVAGYQAPAGGHGPYLAKATLDGRSSINPEVIAVVDRYQAGQYLYLKCQDLGVPKYGSSIWGYTTDGYWVPDYYVKTGTTGFVPGVPRCSSLGISGGAGVPTVPNGVASDIRANIVAAARSQVGVVEGANNCNPYGFCAAWCTMFATWTWYQAGVNVAASRTFGDSTWYFSGSLYQWAVNNDRIRSFGDARPGDIVIYGDSPGRTYHTAVVEYVYSDGDIATIEGNLSNMVRRVSRFNPHLSSTFHPSNYRILAIIAPVKDELTAPTGKPTGLTGAALSTTSVKLTWQGTTDATSYYIERKKLGVSTSYVRLPAVVDSTSYTVTGLAEGRWYRFRVVPANGTLTGPASTAFEVRTRGRENYTNYYALGDSYSSGHGAATPAAPYTGGDCKRTTNAWAYELASSSYVPTPHLYACSGNELPGLRDQLADVPSSLSGPTLITITVGGNDVGFGPEIQNCVLPGSCTDREPIIAATIDNIEDDLRDFYEDVRARAPGADIVVVGYPPLVPAPGAPRAICIELSNSEMDMIYRLGVRLNNVIRSAATAAGVTYSVDEVHAEFTGHEACSLAPYLHAIDVDSMGGDSFHPTTAGQWAYGEAVDDRLNSLFGIGAKRSIL